MSFILRMSSLRRLLLLATVAAGAVAKTKRFTTQDNYTYIYDHIAAQSSQPTVLLLHGFPSSRGDWHDQVDHLSTAGFGVLVPDLIGYGDSDKPVDVQAYRLKAFSGHLDAIIGEESLGTVVGVGHDWGVNVLSAAAVYHPERFEKLAFLSVPYNPPGMVDLDAINAQGLQDHGYTQFGYWYFFNSYDAVDIIVENVRWPLCRLIHDMGTRHFTNEIPASIFLQSSIPGSTIALAQ